MWHDLLYGLILGWGVAIPIGPMNIEIMRRNIRFGTRYGVAFSSGACSADLTYLILLSLGALPFLRYPMVFNVISILGAIVLAWFAWGTFKLKPHHADLAVNPEILKRFVGKDFAQGYLMTLTSPFTILFWASVSSQVTWLSKDHPHAWLFAGTGVLLGTFSWAFGFNAVLHHTKHKISDRWMNALNRLGGVMLLGFAIVGVARVFV